MEGRIVDATLAGLAIAILAGARIAATATFYAVAIAVPLVFTVLISIFVFPFREALISHSVKGATGLRYHGDGIKQKIRTRSVALQTPRAWASRRFDITNAGAFCLSRRGRPARCGATARQT